MNEYCYSLERKVVFTENGLKQLFQIYDNLKSAFKTNPVIMASIAFKGDNHVGDLFGVMACFDYLVETGMIKEIKQKQESAWQYRIFIEK